VTADPAVLDRAVGGFGLPGQEPADVEISPKEWRGFVLSASTGRMVGIAVAAAEAGRLRLTGDQTEELLDRHRDAMLWALAIERRLLGLAEAFEAAGVRPLVLKGPALAHTMYPDPSWRVFGDLDLLVPTSSWRRALDVLAGLGFERRLPEPRPGFDERFGKAAVHANGDGMEIDLHRTLVIGPFGLWARPEELFRRAATFELGGRMLGRLDDTAILLHACMHASLGWRPPLLWTLRDVAQVAWSGRIDWEELADLARRWRLRAVVSHALRTASETLEVSLPVEAASLLGAKSRRRERRALESYVTDRRGRGGTELATLQAIPGLRGKAAYLRMLLFPGRDFLAARGRGSVRRLFVPVRWLAGRRR
jgi:hypothetical protein